MKRYISLIFFAILTAVVGIAGDYVLSPRTRLAEWQKTATRGEDLLRAYLHINPSKLDRKGLEALGVAIAFEKDGIATASVPTGVIDKLGYIEGIEYVEVAALAYQMLDVSREECGAAAVQRGEGLPQPFDGTGVVIGIVDAGFDYTHPAFRNANGELRISRVWEQGATSTGNAPEGFGYGIELVDAEKILEAGGDIRNNSHGTHVAAIAAGADNFMDGALMGMAPGAELVMVSMLDAGAGNVNISDGIAYIFRYAESVGKPCVVNLSLGAHSGPHDGTSSFDRMADSMSGPGQLIIGASGNARRDKFHVTGILADGKPLQTFIDFPTPLIVSNIGGEIEVWGSEGSEMIVELLVVNTLSGETVETITAYPLEEAVASLSLGRNISGTVTAAGEINAVNGKPHLVLTSGVNGLRANHAVAIRVIGKEGTKADIWSDNNLLHLSSRGLEGYIEPMESATVCEIGGTANSIFTVGAYTTRSGYVLYNEDTLRRLDETDGDLGSFSSAGPSADGRMKPQVTAPGCFISSAVSGHDGSGNLLVSQVHETEGSQYLYGYMQGTSMATPNVTGIVATWLQAYPELTPAQLAEIIEATARKDEFTGALEEGSNDWGYGKIDALGGLRKCLELKEQGVVENLIADESSVILASYGRQIKILFTSAAQAASATVWNLDGSLCGTHAFGHVNAGDERLLDYSNLQPGIYLVECAGHTFKLHLR